MKKKEYDHIWVTISHESTDNGDSLFQENRDRIYRCCTVADNEIHFLEDIAALEEDTYPYPLPFPRTWPSARLLALPWPSLPVLCAWSVSTRDAIFRKMANRDQTDTNEMATTKTKYQTNFYSAPKYQYLTKF